MVFTAYRRESHITCERTEFLPRSHSLNNLSLSFSKVAAPFNQVVNKVIVFFYTMVFEFAPNTLKKNHRHFLSATPGLPTAIWKILMNQTESCHLWAAATLHLVFNFHNFVSLPALLLYLSCLRCWMAVAEISQYHYIMDSQSKENRSMFNLKTES